MIASYTFQGSTRSTAAWPRQVLKASWRALRIAAMACAAVAVSLGFAHLVHNVALPNRLQDFFTLTLSILVEATPFVILGSLVAGLVQAFVSEHTMLHILPRSPLGRRLVLSVTGSIFPVCECGNVPIARSLLAKGLQPSEAITFLLAAPILNPLTFITTWEAFRFDRSMVVIRMGGAFLIANFIGWLLHHHPHQVELIVPGAIVRADIHDDHQHAFKYKKDRFMQLFVQEFWSMFTMLSVGAFVAAGSQSFIPRSVLLSVGGHPVWSVLAMLALAFIVSLCANVDAFFALAYSGTFTFGALAAFLLFGPMIDIKTLLLMKTTFRAKALLLIASLCLLCSLAIGLAVNYAL